MEELFQIRCGIVILVVDLLFCWRVFQIERYPFGKPFRESRFKFVLVEYAYWDSVTPFPSLVNCLCFLIKILIPTSNNGIVVCFIKLVKPRLRFPGCWI